MHMKFLADAMLGKLARFLRIFGYDTVYANDLEEYFSICPVPDNKLLEYAIEDDRIIITRDFPFYKKAKERCVYLEGEGVYNYLNQLQLKMNLIYNFNITKGNYTRDGGSYIAYFYVTSIEKNGNGLFIVREKIPTFLPVALKIKCMLRYSLSVCRETLVNGEEREEITLNNKTVTITPIMFQLKKEVYRRLKNMQELQQEIIDEGTDDFFDSEIMKIPEIE